MRIYQLIKVLSKLDSSRRIKFHNLSGSTNPSISINAILEQGNVYIFSYVDHPKCLLDQMSADQRLIWYNPNLSNFKLVNKYFPYYTDIINE